MPKTSTIPPKLQQLLAWLKLTIATLSERTGIEPARIIQIYQEGKPTIYELHCLATVLGPAFTSFLTASLGAELAGYVAHSVQVGIFNQGGSFNEQHNDFNYHNHQHQHQHQHFHWHASEPAPRALDVSPQRQELQPVQPGGVVRQLGQPMQPSGVVRQLGPVGAVRELGKAA